MRVSIKDFAVNMDIKNKGVELDVYDGKGVHLGDLVITKVGITWCKGKTTPAKGKKMSWKDLAKLMEEK